MRLDRRDIQALVWLAVVACGMFGFFGFAIVAPWTSSVMSVADAAARCPGAIDPSWPAVVCDHGRPHKWEYGLISENPVRYLAAWAQMVLGWGLFFIFAQRMKRLGH